MSEKGPPGRAPSDEFADAVAHRVAKIMTPPGGVPIPKAREAAPPSPRAKSNTGLILGVVGTIVAMGGAVVGVTVDLLDRIADRAPAARVEELEQRQAQADRAQAVQDARIAQITTAVGELSGDVKAIDTKVGRILDEVREPKRRH